MRTKYLRTLFAATAMVVLLPQSATAHQQFNGSNKAGIIGGEQGFCVHGQVQQTHSWHQVDTFMSNCNNLRSTWHAQYQEYFKVAPEGWGRWGGTFCFGEGWRVSDHRAVYTLHYGWDIWHWCNNGGGVNVVLSIDSWQLSWKDEVRDWRGGAWRPATWHCHCP